VVNLRRESDARRIQQQTFQQQQQSLLDKSSQMHQTPQQYLARFSPSSPNYSPHTHNSRVGDDFLLSSVNVSPLPVSQTANNSGFGLAAQGQGPRGVRYVKGLNEQLPISKYPQQYLSPDQLTDQTQSLQQHQQSDSNFLSHTASTPVTKVQGVMMQHSVIQVPGTRRAESPPQVTVHKYYYVACLPHFLLQNAFHQEDQSSPTNDAKIRSLRRSQSQQTIDSDISFPSDFFNDSNEAIHVGVQGGSHVQQSFPCTDNSSKPTIKKGAKERPRSTGGIASKHGMNNKRSKLFQNQALQSSRNVSDKEPSNRQNLFHQEPHSMNLIEGLTDKDVAALRIGRLIIGSVINSPETATSDVISRFFLDNWLSKHGSSAAKADILSIDLLCQLEKYKSIKDFIINTEQTRQEEDREKEASDSQRRHTVITSENSLKMNESIIEAHKVMAIVAYGALNKMAAEYAESSPVLAEIISGLRPMMFTNTVSQNETSKDDSESTLKTWMEKSYELHAHTELLENTLSTLEEQNNALREDVMVLESTLQMLQDGQINVDNIDATISSFSLPAAENGELIHLSQSGTADEIMSKLIRNRNTSNTPSIADDNDTINSEEDNNPNFGDVGVVSGAGAANLSNANSRHGSFSTVGNSSSSVAVGMLRHVQRRPTFKNFMNLGANPRLMRPPPGRDAFSQTEPFAGYKPISGGPLAAMHESMQSKKSTTELKTLQVVIDTLTAELAEMAQKLDFMQQQQEQAQSQVTNDLQVQELTQKLADAEAANAQLTDAHKILNSKHIDLTNKMVLSDQRLDEEVDKMNASVAALVEKLGSLKILPDVHASTNPQNAVGGTMNSARSANSGNGSQKGLPQLDDDTDIGEQLILSVRGLTEKFNPRNRKRTKLTISDYIAAHTAALTQTLEAGVNNRNELLTRINLDKLARDRKEKELRTELDSKKKEISNLVNILKDAEGKYITLKQDTDHSITRLTSEYAQTKTKLEETTIKNVALAKQIDGYKRSMADMKEDLESQITDLEAVVAHGLECMCMYEEDVNAIHLQWILDKTDKKSLAQNLSDLLRTTQAQTQRIEDLEGERELR
jgi:hypothetical protein